MKAGTGNHAEQEAGDGRGDAKPLQDLRNNQQPEEEEEIRNLRGQDSVGAEPVAQDLREDAGIEPALTPPPPLNDDRTWPPVRP